MAEGAVPKSVADVSSLVDQMVKKAQELKQGGQHIEALKEYDEA